MNKLRNQNAITLISLIVTAVIMTITIGITLKLIAGSNGIIAKAARANDQHHLATIKEDVEITLAGVKANYFAAEDRREYTNFEEYWHTNLPPLTAQKCSLTKDEDPETGEILITYEDKKGKLYDISTDPVTNGILVTSVEGAENDTIPPVIGTPVCGVTNIRVTIKDSRGSGVSAYMVKQNSTTPSADDENWVEISGAPKTYILNVTGLSVETTYYIFAKDARDNISTAREATTKSVPVATAENITVESTTWENADATVTFSTTETDYSIQLSITPTVANSWTSVNSITIPSGTTIYARLADDYGNAGTHYSANTPYKISAVSYSANGGTGDVPDEQIVQHTETVTVRFNTLPTRANYQFLGWSTSSSATKPAYTSNGTITFTMGTEDITLYAVWDINKYTISYNANGGTGSTTSQTKIHGTAINLSSNGFTAPTGKEFKEWNTKADGNGTSYVAGASYTENANLNLYAIWGPPTYSITYNANGGSGSLPSVQSYQTGTTVYLDFDTKPTKSGYSFLGWSTSNSASFPEYTKNGTNTITINSSNINLYAIYYNTSSPVCTFTSGDFDTGETSGTTSSNDLITCYARLTDGVRNQSSSYGALLLYNGSYIYFTLYKNVNISFSSGYYRDSAGSSGEIANFYKEQNGNYNTLYCSVQQQNNSVQYGKKYFPAGRYLLQASNPYVTFEEWDFEVVE